MNIRPSVNARQADGSITLIKRSRHGPNYTSRNRNQENNITDRGKESVEHPYLPIEVRHPSTIERLITFVKGNNIRSRVSANINFSYVYQLPVPRLTGKDPQFAPIVERAARLICTTPEFDALAKQVGLKSHKDGVTDPTQRAKLRAQLDALIAHLYGLTEQEFAHILTRTFHQF